jgi:hypothetical protein
MAESVNQHFHQPRQTPDLPVGYYVPDSTLTLDFSPHL